MSKMFLAIFATLDSYANNSYHLQWQLPTTIVFFIVNLYLEINTEEEA